MRFRRTLTTGKKLDILNKKVYNINRVGENVVSVEEYDAASVSATTFAATDLTHVGTMHYSFDSAANVAGNYLGGKLVYISKGWFKPKYVVSFLKGSYGQKLIAQTGIGTVLNLIVNLIRKLFKV